MRNEARVREMMPVDLLIEDRRCLVVGGGAVAARKVGHLLAAGARVTVVSAEACAAIEAWKREGRLRHRRRNFRNSDLNGAFIVFAATGDNAVNGRIVRLCRRRRILCSAVDASWTEGDFVTPALLRRPRLTLAVSTGGQSCRRARLIKDCLARHIGDLDSADLLAISVSHPAQSLGAMLHQVWGVHEFMLVPTPGGCELFAVAARDTATVRLLRGLLDASRVRRGEAAFARLARLAQSRAGHLVENELAASTRAGWSGVMLHDWLAAAQSLRQNAGDYRRKYAFVIRGFQSGDAVE
jgi:siroheme synthase-like protein